MLQSCHALEMARTSFQQSTSMILLRMLVYQAYNLQFISVFIIDEFCVGRNLWKSLASNKLVTQKLF